MAELTPKQSREGLDFANKVADLALSAPHRVAKRAALSTADWLRKFYGFSECRKRELIAQSLRDGCSTYEDLAKDLQFKKPEVIRLVKEMESFGEVILEPLQRGDRGGRGQIYIRLTGQSSRKIPEK